MSRKGRKNDVVAFKVEEELAEFLNKLPNKSAFIRKAIFAQMSMACPLCHGTGQVSRWVHDHYAPFLSMARKCDGCGTAIPFPEDPGTLTAADQHRMEQYFKGGPLYCDPCYDEAPACGDCGMHVGERQAAEHVKAAHRAEGQRKRR
jgi:hypothetical protein